jgi:hypothetical protein
VPSNAAGTTTDTTVTTHDCLGGEIFRRGHCVSSGAPSANNTGCSREVFGRLGHCPPSRIGHDTPYHNRFDGGNNDARFPPNNRGNNNRGSRYPDQGGNNTPR